MAGASAAVETFCWVQNEPVWYFLFQFHVSQRNSTTLLINRIQVIHCCFVISLTCCNHIFFLDAEIMGLYSCFHYRPCYNELTTQEIRIDKPIYEHWARILQGEFYHMDLTTNTGPYVSSFCKWKISASSEKNCCFCWNECCFQTRFMLKPLQWN